jgi:Zn-dependent protease
MLVAAAGPASNIAQAVIAALIFRAMFPLGSEITLAGAVLLRLVAINLLLAFFNLVPIPPLDGGNVLAGMLPPSAANIFVGLRRYGFLLLYALMISGVLTYLILPPVQLLGRILVPGGL